MNVRVRRSHERDRRKRCCGSRGENRKRRWRRDERLAVGDGNERTDLRANLRSFSELDIAAASEDLVKHVRREENVCNGVFNADRRFVSDRRVDGQPRRWRDQRQRFAVGQLERLEKNIDVTVYVAACSRANVEHFNELRASGRGERHSVDAQRIGEMRADDFAALRGYRRERIVERKEKRGRRWVRSTEGRGDRLPRRRGRDDDRAERRRGEERCENDRYERKRCAERTQMRARDASSRALLPRRRLRRAYPVR